MNQDITIRQAEPSDCDAVFWMARAMATSFQVEKSEFSQSFFEVLEEPSAVCWVATNSEQSEQAVGYLLGFDHRAFYSNGRVSWIEEVFVSETFRKAGIGRKLIEAFEAWCLERESKLVGLATRRASAFYQAIGYEESAIFFRRLLKEKESHSK